jgi:signal transduction histidine kinase
MAITPLFRAIPLPTAAPGGRTVLSTIQADPIDGTPLIGIAVATDGGSPSPMSITALQRLNDISLILAGEDTALGWQTAVVDQDGKAVVASEPALVGKLFVPQPWPEAALRRESVHRARVDDVDRYLAVAPATVVQWRVVSRVPADVLDAPSRYEVFSVLLLGGLLALPVAVSVLLGRYLGNRLETLANAAREVPSGAISHAVEATGLREIDVVSQALLDASAAAREQAETRERIQVIKDGLELAQRMESVGQVMAGMAHDFGNLIFTIRGNLELLRRDFDADSRERPLIEPSLRLADEAMKLISQLSASARRTRQQTRLVNLNADLDGIIDLLRQVAGRSVTVTIQMDRDLLDCRLDPTLLRSALLNLVVNARKAMPRGGEIGIVSRNVLLDESAALSKGLAAGPYVSVSVEDNGTGIPPELRSRIFEPFFTTRESDGGTGFGLSILDGFVKAVGGHVSVHSVVGKGTRFTLYFPAEHRETADAAGLARGETP